MSGGYSLTYHVCLCRCGDLIDYEYGVHISILSLPLVKAIEIFDDRSSIARICRCKNSSKWLIALSNKILQVELSGSLS